MGNIYYILLAGFTVDLIYSGMDDCETALKALQRNTSLIIESGIEYDSLARLLYSAEVITEAQYDKFIDDDTRKSNASRLEEILKAVRSCVKLDVKGFGVFLQVLKEGGNLGQKKIAEKLEDSYKSNSVGD